MRELNVHGAVFDEADLTDRILHATDRLIVVAHGNEPIGLLTDSRIEKRNYAKDQMRELDA